MAKTRTSAFWRWDLPEIIDIQNIRLKRSDMHSSKGMGMIRTYKKGQS